MRNRIRTRTAAWAAGAVLLGLTGAGARLWAQATAPRLLVDKGKPLFTIVIPSPPGPFDRRAAEILRDAVFKMSGAIPAIVAKASPGKSREIDLGFPKDKLPRSWARSIAGLKEDGFLLVARRNITIASGGHKGVIYGVVHILEKYFGCRKLSPTEEVFPRRETLVLPPLFLVENPVNEFRAVNGEFSKDPDYQDWLRLDTVDDVFAKGWYVHTFNKLVPGPEYFEKHPEYFAWMNGKRVKDQLCLSNPDVLRLAIDKLRAEMAAQPGKKVWSVSQNDNSSYCQCPDCSRTIAEEGSPSGPIIRFVNAVAAAFPDKTISTLAYQYSRPAPRKTRPAPNVQIMLCTIELDRSLPIAEDPGSRPFLQDLEDWGRIARQIYLWDYTVNFSHHVSPFPNLHVLQPNIALFVRGGARQHFQQANTGVGHEFSELKSFLLARFLWNPAADARAEMDDFLGNYYHAAAPFIRSYIAALQGALAETGARLDIYEPPNAHAEDYLSEDRVELYNRLFDQAEAAAGTDLPVLERVKAARLPLQYAMLEIGKNDMFGPRGFYEERAGRFELKPRPRALLEDFYSVCQRNGVRTLNESGLTPKDYYDASLRFIDVQVEGNLAFRKTVTADPPPAEKYEHGDLAALTNGVRGANDYKVHWLGWEGVDFELVLDLEKPVLMKEISLSTLYDPKSWILHPRRVGLLVSADGAAYRPIGAIQVDGDQRFESVTRTFTWNLAVDGVRFVKFRVEGTKRLPDWHPSAGGLSWVFVDEIVVR